VEKLESKGWIKTDPTNQTIDLINLNQLVHLARKTH
jgi:hypothetical protein